MNNDFGGLADDRGTPIRWKAATVLSLAAFVITLALLLTSAGARAERLETVVRDVKDMKALPAKVDRLETWKEDVMRRLTSIDETQKEMLKELRRR
jgi:hypothetical protein